MSERRLADGIADDDEVTFTCTVNGGTHTLRVPADRRLLSVLRDELGLVGTKLGCEVGVCGICTVLVDGRPTSSCLTLAAQVDGSRVDTIEGLSDADDPRFAELQRAFLDEGASQCGFCTGGQLTSLAALQRENRLANATRADIVQWLHGNLCRCTGYYGILRAAGRASS